MDTGNTQLAQENIANILAAIENTQTDLIYADAEIELALNNVSETPQKPDLALEQEPEGTVEELTPEDVLYELEEETEGAEEEVSVEQPLSTHPSSFTFFTLQQTINITEVIETNDKDEDLDFSSIALSHEHNSNNVFRADDLGTEDQHRVGGTDNPGTDNDFFHVIIDDIVSDVVDASAASGPAVIVVGAGGGIGAIGGGGGGAIPAPAPIAI